MFQIIFSSFCTIKDPFETKTVVNQGGTKDEPNLVQSIFNERIIACACEYCQEFFHFKIFSFINVG